MERNKLIYIEPNPSKGFNFGYLVKIPDNLKNINNIIVEPCNSSPSCETIEENINEAHQKFNQVHRVELLDLGFIFMMPIFPRLREDEEKLIHIQSLNRKAMLIEDGPCKRGDLQLINMIEDLKERLSENSINVNDKIMLYGYSLSAKFVYRFALMHPELVSHVCAGGVGACMPIPLDKLGQLDLIYPVGTYDLDKLVGKPFNEDAYRKIRHFYFMGREEFKSFNSEKTTSRDITLWESLYGRLEKGVIDQALGVNMVTRWDRLTKIYEELGYDNLVCKLYEGEHTSKPAQQDIYKFFCCGAIDLDRGIKK